MKKLFKKTTVYVVRCDSQNNFQDSAPCEKCLGTMLDLNIKRIVFSGKNNTFISGPPNDIKIYHISAGNKFIKNKENMMNNLEKERKERKESKESKESKENKESINKFKNKTNKKYKKISRQ